MEVISLVPRPLLVAFFMEKNVFFPQLRKSCEGRPGYEARKALGLRLVSFDGLCPYLQVLVRLASPDLLPEL